MWEKQPEINAEMRSIFINWLVEVTEDYKLLDESLFLSCQLHRQVIYQINL